MPDRPKSILFIWTDQQRPDTIGAYGNPKIQTPHVDRLAAGGILFEQAYCTQPVCSPSRASVLTGLYPHTHRVLQNNIPLPQDVPTIAELIRDRGYTGGYVGKWHLGNELGRPALNTHGFDVWVSTEDTYTRDRATEGYSDYHHFLVSRGYTPPDEARDGAKVFSRPTAARLPEEVGKPAFQAAACARFLETHGREPFLLMVSFLEPHPPYFSPFDNLYPPEEMELPESWYREMEDIVPLRYRRRRQAYAGRDPHVDTNDERGWKELKARYWGACTLVDKYVGRILQRLEALDLADDTIVVYSTDHGEMLGEHRLLQKSVQYEGAARVPLIMRVPGLAPHRIATPTGQIDIVPTLLDLLDQPAPAHLQGTSLVPLLASGDRAPDDAEVVIEWNGLERQISGSGELSDAREVEARLRSVDTRTIRRGRWKLNVHLSREFELYDLQQDPGELHNAFHDPGNEPIIRALYDRLLAWQRETNDTLELPNPVGT
ncbi:MAG: sulfatase-like hydrolase/transferase [Chloroflexi bacterium]|nr:sulfatase-like hydrolase/transferase [Chloroflexota bacterium]